MNQYYINYLKENYYGKALGLVDRKIKENLDKGNTKIEIGLNELNLKENEADTFYKVLLTESLNAKINFENVETDTAKLYDKKPKSITISII